MTVEAAMVSAVLVDEIPDSPMPAGNDVSLAGGVGG